jgi:hypothetical protein
MAAAENDVVQIVYEDTKRKELIEKSELEYHPIDFDKIVKDVNELDELEGDEFRRGKVEENIQSFEEMLETEDEFLELFPQNNKKFEVKVPYKGRLIAAEIKPLIPGMNARVVEMDSGLFTNLTKAQRNALTKYNKGEELSKHELKLIQDLAEKQSREVPEILIKVNCVLAQHIVKFGPKTSYYNTLNDYIPPKKEWKDFKYRKNKLYAGSKFKFWTEGSGSDIFLKNGLFPEILDILGASQNQQFKLFRSS